MLILYHNNREYTLNITARGRFCQVSVGFVKGGHVFAFLLILHSPGLVGSGENRMKSVQKLIAGRIRQSSG